MCIKWPEDRRGCTITKCLHYETINTEDFSCDRGSGKKWKCMTEILELIELILVYVAEYLLWMVNGHRKSTFVKWEETACGIKVYVIY